MRERAHRGGARSTRDPPWRRGRTLLRYGVAVTAVLVALLLTRVLASYVESFRTPLFFSTIMLSTWFGGFIPGLVATLLSVLALKYDDMPSISAWSFDLRHVPLFVICSGSALLISWVMAKQQQAGLAHVTRVTTMGELADSIAHEVNQPIAADLGTSEITSRCTAGRSCTRCGPRP